MNIKRNIDSLSGVIFVGLKNLEDWGSKIWISKINAFGPNGCLNLLMKRVFGKALLKGSNCPIKLLPTTRGFHIFSVSLGRSMINSMHVVTSVFVMGPELDFDRILR